MTTQEIKTKIKERESWLKANHYTHPDYTTIYQDWMRLNKELNELKTIKKQ